MSVYDKLVISLLETGRFYTFTGTGRYPGGRAGWLKETRCRLDEGGKESQEGDISSASFPGLCHVCVLISKYLRPFGREDQQRGDRADGVFMALELRGVSRAPGDPEGTLVQVCKYQEKEN